MSYPNLCFWKDLVTTTSHSNARFNRFTQLKFSRSSFLRFSAKPWFSVHCNRFFLIPYNHLNAFTS